MQSMLDGTPAAHASRQQCCRPAATIADQLDKLLGLSAKSSSSLGEETKDWSCCRKNRDKRALSLALIYGNDALSVGSCGRVCQHESIDAL